MNYLGNAFKVTTFGESHGKAIGVVIDGCPAGINIKLALVQEALQRRRPGQSCLTSSRNEKDQLSCLSGLENSTTLGSPISLIVTNHDIRPQDYTASQQAYRPSHADFTYAAKYGTTATSGGGRASARETVARVAAGAIAEQLLTTMCHNLRIVAYVSTIKNISGHSINSQLLTRCDVEKSLVRCPDLIASQKMATLIAKTRDQGDSVGGIISCSITGCPVGLGEPVFGKLEAQLSHAMLSIPAARGIEFGSGFKGTQLYGSEHNDAFIMSDNGIATKTNNSGGIQGGISNGMEITFNVAFKPTSTILKPQQTLTRDGKHVILLNKGRHDPCVLPRAVPIVESMAAIVICDLFLQNRCHIRNS